MQVLRFLWSCMLMSVSSVLWADEIYQKIHTLSEINETDTYIICDENGENAMFKGSGSFRGATSYGQNALQGNLLIVDPDTQNGGKIPDEYHFVKVGNDIYRIWLADGSGCLHYDNSNNYLRIKEHDSSDRSKWVFKQVDYGVGIDCKSRKNIHISYYGSKFGVYEDNSTGHPHAILYKKIATQSKRIIISEARYSSFVSPPKINIAASDDLNTYVVNSANSNQAQLKQIGDIPKNTPVILQGEPGDYLLHYTNQTISDISDNLLQKSNGKITGDGQTIYSLARIDGQIGFYIVAENVKIPEGKVYLKIMSPSNAKFLSLSELDETGIATRILSPQSEKGNVFYDLQGVMVKNSQRGIFIRNGRKYSKNR